MKILKWSIPVLVSFILLTSCNLEKTVDIDLPSYQSEPVVECYLEPGKPMRLLLTRSFAFFDDFDFNDPTKTLLGGATVYVRYGTENVLLTEGLYVDLVHQKIANYGANAIVPENYSDTFFLDIALNDGTTLSAVARIMPQVMIDSIRVEFNAQNQARLLTYFTEDSTQSNYYRRMLNVGTLDSLPDQDFVVRDDFFDSEKGAFGTGFSFEKGDTVINTLIHIEEPYFQYYNTLRQAVAAGFNPFGQPGQIVGNIQGSVPAHGIFTGFKMSRDTTIIP